MTNIVDLHTLEPITGEILDDADWEKAFISVLATTTLVVDAQVVVELGTGKGRSTRAFLAALKLTGGILHTVDKAAHPEIIAYLENEEQVVFITGDSIEVGQRWEHGAIDILLCDSAHIYDHVMAELETWGKFNPQVIFVHDTWNNGEPSDIHRAACDYAIKHKRKMLNLTYRRGLGMII